MSPLLLQPQDGLEPQAVLAAGEAVRNFCGWHISPVITETITVDGPGGPAVALPTLRLVDVASVAVRLTDGTYGPVDPLLWEWSTSGFIRRTDGWVFTNRLRGLQLSITHGFQTCPPEVAAVVRGLAQGGAVAQAATSQTAGPFSVTYSEDRAAGPLGIGPYESAILARYRLPSLT